MIAIISLWYNWFWFHFIISTSDVMYITISLYLESPRHSKNSVQELGMSFMYEIPNLAYQLFQFYHRTVITSSKFRYWRSKTKWNSQRMYIIIIIIIYIKKIGCIGTNSTQNGLAPSTIPVTLIGGRKRKRIFDHHGCAQNVPRTKEKYINW